jgi:hypothetical protein
MALTRRRAIAFGRENVEGTALGTGALTAYELAIDPTTNFDTPKKRRRLANESLSEQKPIEGLKSGTMSFEVEAASHLTLATRPVWADLVEACGFRSGEGTLVAIPIGAVTGSFIDGEAVTGTGLTAGTAFGATYNGTTWLLIENATGSIAASGVTLTGGTSGATATSTAASRTPSVMLKPYSERTYSMAVTGSFSVSAGDILTGGTSGAQALVLESGSSSPVKVMPVDGTGTFSGGESLSGFTSGSGTFGAISSKYLPSLTMVQWDSERVKKIKGARGTFSLTMPVGEEPRFAFTFTGARESAEDGTLPSVNRLAAGPPPVWIAGSSFIDDLADPALREFSIDVGAAVALRPSPSEASGYISARIGARAVGATINPEITSEAAFDILEKARDGEAFSVGAVVGSTAGRRLFVNLPRVVADQVAEEDADGMQHDGISLIPYSSPIDNEEHEVVLAIL